jgi:hypothetical protein
MTWEEGDKSEKRRTEIELKGWANEAVERAVRKIFKFSSRLPQGYKKGLEQGRRKRDISADFEE